MMLSCTKYSENNLKRPVMSKDLSKVFKAYDIRGLSPEELNGEFAKRLGLSIAAHFKPKRVLVGRDMRTTSPVLESMLIQGLTESGVDVVRIGLCSTPMFYNLTGLAQSLEPFDLGIMVTASHNPGIYNGFKIIHGDCLPVGQGNGMEELRDAFLRGDQIKADHPGTAVDEPGSLDKYIELVIRSAKLPSDMPQFKVAIDAGNGMAGSVLPRLLERLPWLEALPMYFIPDGTFPNHEANPLKIENLKELIAKVKQEKCHLGVSFDGDADRVGFIDENGEPIPGDLMTAFLAQEILKGHPGGKVLIDIRASWAAQEAVKEAGGVFEFSRVGHALIKKQMRETGAVFAGEISMHMYFHELWNCECSDLAMLLVLRRMATTGQTLSELIRPLLRYKNSGEINFKLSAKAEAIKALSEKYSAQASFKSELDGVRLEFRDQANPQEDWWFNVRASNTEPLLRLVVEAKTDEVLSRRTAELKEFLAAYVGA